MTADLTRDITRICEEATKLGDLDPEDIVTLTQYVLSEPARLAAARDEGFREAVEHVARLFEAKGRQLTLVDGPELAAEIRALAPASRPRSSDE
jgi:hypothetical protein